MADVDYDEYEGGYGASYEPMGASQRQRWINIAGGLTSLALVLGVGVWGYKIAVRNVMGIPVVRALEGPMREAPATPGGDVAANQGLAVNNIAAVGTASPTADRLVLAPRPVELSLDDAPGLTATPPPVEGEVVAAVPEALPATQPEAAPAVAPADAAVMAALAPNDNVEALADQLAAGAAPLAEASLGDVEAPPPVSGGVGTSLRPLARPANAAVMVAVTTPAVAAPVTDIDPATLVVGTRLVQLGAFDDVETANKEWDKLALRFGELLAGKGRVVQSAQSGGRTFFRLRAAGFEGEDDARRFCSALLAENAACIPVAVR